MRSESSIRRRIAQLKDWLNDPSTHNPGADISDAAQIDALQWVLQSPRKPKKAKKGAAR